MDLMDMVKGAVSKQVMGQIGGILGTDEKKTSSVFETAAGSILGGLIKKAGSEQGARDVFDMASNQDSGVLDKLGDILGGDGVDQDYQDRGGSILEGVFGGQQANLLGTIAKFLGLDSGLIGKLLPMIAPIVMSVIGKYVKDKALDAVGLGNFLGEQKKSLGFMPSSLTSDLGFGNLLGNVTDSVGGAVNAVGDAGQAAVGQAGQMVGDAGKAAANMAGDAAESGGNILKLLLPLVLVGLLGFAAYQFLFPANNGGNQESALTIPGIEIPEGTDFGGVVPRDIQNLSNKFSAVTDGFKNVTMDNASELGNKMALITETVGDIGLNKLPESGKGVVGGMIGKFIESITGSMGGLDEGIQGILKPFVDALIEKLSPFKS